MHIKLKCLLTLAILEVTLHPAYGQTKNMLKFSPRGFECEHIEFAEANSMKKQELEALYCSQKEGMDFSTESTMAATEGAAPEVRIALNQRMFEKRNQCSSEMSRASSIFTRKFGGWPDCKKMPKSPPT
jgi:hypothetical protein